MKRVVVIGAGFSGLTAAAALARRGHQVTIVEKNAEPGGRARTWSSKGFTFDLGPSFYWMPEVFERFFQEHGTKASEHYELKRLDPSYSIVFKLGERWPLPADRGQLEAFFESKEQGAGAKLRAFLDEAKPKYDIGMGEIVYRPSLSWTEYMHPGLLLGLMKTTVFRSLRSHVAGYFDDPRLKQAMEFPVLFLGATPQNTPALYSLMNYADMVLGTWYPMGGMGKIVDAFLAVAQKQGATLRAGEPVKRIVLDGDRVKGVETDKGVLEADVVIGAADYQHVDQQLLPEDKRGYGAAWWDKRTMAPSGLLFYLGFDRKLPNLDHHTLFFDESLDDHAAEIYDQPRWPTKPLFYTSCSSKTDPSSAPEGCDNLVVLIPLAPGLEDTDEMRAKYREVVMGRLATHFGFDPRPHVVLERSYSLKDLKADYNAFRGNAYGLANTLLQTGPLRPRMKSKEVKGLYYAGQLTVPGPGVPPAIISGQVVAELVHDEMR
jgi:phytoene desaturase